MSGETERTCSKCDKTQPIDEYYELRSGVNGRMAHCRTCNNKRPPTENRVIYKRARNRAYADLVKRHADEFNALLEDHKAKALAELEELREAAATQRDEDVALPRLKPGPKRNTDSSVVDRLDVARCPHCHSYHDHGHECETCGDVPVELVDAGLDIDYVAIERRMKGDRSVVLNRDESHELIRLWIQQGGTVTSCVNTTGIRADRLDVSA
ncbi:hypothetical protein [Aeromicrobium sp. 9AM]|uniref:hypothetical protein n=1 Tax=Aeromicrobium sp. 9AM TaxID=2653126 RepID=UPI0012F384BD|nr:hypothetical protein [Aeromicrobium sp. 9AM]VXC07074.1 hypothetical protein AERO9AM_30604 [Aeromicrobium sp. 9AM]